MNKIDTDIVIVGAGGAGLRAAIAVAETDPNLKVALLSKVYPMRSHTVAAEGGAAGVYKAEDSLEKHFHDTVSGGDWLCDQDAVDMFVEQAPRQLTQLEHWGCPWSRQPDGSVAVRAFGGMKVERTWYAADKSGFHILHTLYQTSLQFPSISSFDEYYTTDLLVEDGRVAGVTAIEMRTGIMHQFRAKAVIMASGGAGWMFPFTTNGAIKTADGMAMAYRAGVPLKDMEFVQYHPTGLPGTGILLTEGCRGEGGILVNKDGYRYLQDYDLGPPDPFPRNKAMELGPRDRLSQAFWHEQQKGNTVSDPRWGEVVHLDMRHLGEKKINERLPLVRDLASSYVGADPVHELVPVRPVIHYVMGGIHTNIDGATPVAGLYAIGECACVSINGANRLGSNSLTELLVFGNRAGQHAVEYVSSNPTTSDAAIGKEVEKSQQRLTDLFAQEEAGETFAGLRKELNDTLEEGAGIYRTEDSLQDTCKKVAELRQRYKRLHLDDKSNVFNTNMIYTMELGSMLEAAHAMVNSALQRTESRGSHQRLDYTERDDKNFLKHSLAYHNGDDDPRIDYLDVVITRSQPAERVYGGDV